MSRKKSLIILILVLTLIASVSCVDTNMQKEVGGNSEHLEQEKAKEREEKIIAQLRKFNETDVDLSKTIKFIDENVDKVSKGGASLMISLLEEAHNNHLQNFEENFFHSDIQEGFIDVFNSGTDLEDIENIDNEELNKLLAETKNMGYRVETVEGMFFPIIDYRFYEKYNCYVTEDMKAYIEIMSIESTEIPARDAGLAVSWDELIDRAIRQEGFITEYPDSIQIDKTKKIFSNYINFIFYGLDNTPLFNHGDNSIRDNAKKAYLETIKSESDSKLIETLADFVNVLEQNDYKLTGDVNDFRKNAVERITGRKDINGH
ncbi:MAG: hypothetical protein ACOCG5_08485 [Candidatus Alkaliphilus sp. MAG34]|nr:hypothetical protein [Clostridiales bacterium]